MSKVGRTSRKGIKNVKKIGQLNLYSYFLKPCTPD